MLLVSDRASGRFEWQDGRYPNVALIDDIREKVRRGEFEFSEHALTQTIVREFASMKCGRPSRPVR